MKKIKPALLKKFVLEFESIVNKANSKFEEDKNIDDYMVELSKAVGLTASISHESQMLMLELMEEIQTVIAPQVHL